MVEEPAFPYMPRPRAAARWVERPCRACGAAGPTLDTQAFGAGEVPGGICVACVRAGKGPQRDVALLREKLRESIKAKDAALPPQKVARLATDRLEELARTPPVAGLKASTWPICCGDFARALGEWTKEDWTRAARDGKGQSALGRVLGDPQEAASVFKELPEAAGGTGSHATYVFRCGVCAKLHAIAQ